MNTPVELSSSPLEDIECDALLVGLFEGEALGSDASELNALLSDTIGQAAAHGRDAELSGKRGQSALFYTGGAISAHRVVLLGLGKRDDFSPQVLREVTGVAVRQMRDHGLKRIASLLHRAGRTGATALDEVRGLAAASAGAGVLALWEPDSYKAQADRKGRLDHLVVAEPSAANSAELTAAVTEGTRSGIILAESANMARTLVNEPANALPPAAMAERARLMAADVGLDCEILDEDDMYRLNMGGILSVSVGSENRARVIILRHTPNPGDPEVALVGKGITFDTGGISIKPSENMGAMKGDMAGAASVIGAMRALALLKTPVNVVGVAPCAENMPSGKAFRPGDVVRFMNGKTAEIISTDAEGRLVLGDALAYAIRNLRAKRVVDVATLTGACVVALGHVATGAWTNNSEWMDALRRASEVAAERVWEMPLFDEYMPLIKSDIADMKNSGGRAGGAITAALFLKAFVDETPWVHLDIAGTSVTDTASHLAKGPTGVMVRTFVELAGQLAS